MPSVSKKQQKFFGIVRAIQKGEMAPTTPETAKAAADMKKGDVKKFASTKHKGLPEKKKLKEFVQNISNLKESDFTNITTGNKVGQTFQHATGATITLDGALGGKMMVPSQVTISLPFGDGDITVDGPSESDFSLAGFTKPLDLKLQKRIEDQSVEEINDRLDASKEASGAETAKVTEMKVNYDKVREGNPNLPSFDELTSDIKLPDIPKEGWTYDQYMAMIEAIKAAGATAEEPIVKEIIAYSPTGTKIFIDKHGQRNTPVGLIDAQAAITAAVHKAITALDAAWEAYNKVPDLSGDGSEESDDGDGFVDTIANKLGKGPSKNVFDTYMNELDKGKLTSKPYNINNILQNDATGNQEIAKLQNIIDDVFLDSNYKNDIERETEINKRYLEARKTFPNLKNIIGQFDYDKKDGFKITRDNNGAVTSIKVNKAFDFTGFKDMAGADVITGIPAMSYATYKGLPKYFKSDDYKVNRRGRKVSGKRVESPTMNLEIDFKISNKNHKKKNKYDKLGRLIESKLSFEQFREESNPRIPRKKGQPAKSKKHSDLYTDEDPKGTIHGLGFKDVAKAKASVSKIRNSSRSHAHKIQAAVAMEQRAREMGKTSEAAVYRKYINSMKKKTKEMNEGRKKYKDLTEGMTTSNAFTVILPARRGVDLQNFQTGLTGDGGIDYGQSNVNDSQLTGDGEYTGLSVMGDITTVEDPTGVGPWLRHRDFDFGDNPSKQSVHGGTYASSSAIGVGAAENQIPGYVPASFRVIRLTGDWSSGRYVNRFGSTDDRLGLPSGRWNSNDGVTRKGYGTALEFMDGAWMATKDIDTTEVDTLKIHARVRDISQSHITSADDQTEVYYWAGNKPGFKSVSGDTIYAGGEGIGQNKPNDGWRPLNQKPDGSFDNSVSTVLIGPVRASNPDNVLQAHSIHIPEWARGKNSRFIIFSKGNNNQGTFSMTSLRFQRKNTMSIQVPLGDPEGSNFIRGGIIDGKTTTPEERKKRVAEMLKTSSQYVTGKFGKGFPGQPTVTAGDSTFDTKRFTEETQVKKKKLKDITEGMTTTNAYSIVLPARGNVDLDTLQLGATGSDLTYTPSTLDSVVDGEFTSLTNTDAIDRVNDPHDMGTNIRTPQPTNQTTFTANDISHTGAAPNTFPPYKPGDTGGTRGVGISGQYNVMQDPSYRASQGPTNENIPVNDVNSFNGDKLYGDGGIVGTHTFWGQGAGAIAGFPRFAALKAVDTTEMDTLTMNWFMYGGYGVDTESGSPTEGETVTLTSSKFSQPGDGVVVYYWAGDKEGAKSFAPSVTGMSKTNDGWRPINVKPDGTTDNSYDPYLISHKPDGAFYNSGARQKHEGGYPSHVLLNNKITLPPWCRDKNTRFLLHQGTNSAGSNRANFGITSIRFQRQNAQTISVKLDSPEGSNFVRGGIIDGKATTPEERKKRVADILKLSSQYVTNKFGKGFPGQPTVTAGDSTFDTKRFNEETSIEEQTTFPQMQQRIRDAKEKRREQQKKSEKLYMDTKRKGVKFYDKKGTGRLKDGKKIYD